MDRERPGPRTIVSTPGAMLALEPTPANYSDEIPAEVYGLIDETCPQDIAETGVITACLKW